jgi:hypothetical protein
MTTSNHLQLAIPLILWTALSGCALTPGRVVLNADPAAVTLEGGAGREVVVFPVEDRREDTERCGVKRNSFGAETADVRCQPEPAVWLVELTLRGLHRAGFRPVTLITKTTADPLQLRLELEHLFIDVVPGVLTLTFIADVHVIVRAETASGLVATRSFFVKVKEESALGTNVPYQRAMDRATKALVARIVRAVVKLADESLPEGPAPARPAEVSATRPLATAGAR